jgi:hypothetical protein
MDVDDSYADYPEWENPYVPPEAPEDELSAVPEVASMPASPPIVHRAQSWGSDGESVSDVDSDPYEGEHVYDSDGPQCPVGQEPQEDESDDGSEDSIDDRLKTTAGEAHIEIYPLAGAGHYLPDTPTGEPDTAWFPFKDSYDYNTARLLTKANTGQTTTSTLFSANVFHGDRLSFHSGVQHRDLTAKLDPDLGLETWTHKTVTGGHEYWYRNPAVIAQHLLRQRAYRDDMVYAPIREYNAKGARVTSEMHTADWWWETQVRYSYCHLPHNRKH